MEPSQGVRTWQWVVTVIVIIVLIIIGVLVFGGKGSEVPATTDQTTDTTDQNLVGLNRITMTDQYPGNVVYLNSVQFEKPGYVAVYSDKDGQLGSVLGSTAFGAGINPGKVTLSKPMIDGKVYYAVMHSDDGDGKFDAVKDAPLKDSKGNVIMKTFRATTAASAGLKG